MAQTKISTNYLSSCGNFSLCHFLALFDFVRNFIKIEHQKSFFFQLRIEKELKPDKAIRSSEQWLNIEFDLNGFFGVQKTTLHFGHIRRTRFTWNKLTNNSMISSSCFTKNVCYLTDTGLCGALGPCEFSRSNFCQKTRRAVERGAERNVPKGVHSPVANFFSQSYIG